MKSRLILALCILLPSLAYADVSFSHTLPGEYQPSHIPTVISDDDADTLYGYRIDAQTGSISFDIYDDNFNVVKSFSAQLPEYSTDYYSGYVQPNVWLYLPNGAMFGGAMLFKSYFGSSGKYEYILPQTCSETITDQYGTVFNTPVNGFSVKTEDGAEVMSVRFPSGYYAASSMMLQIQIYNRGNRLKALVQARDKQGEQYTLVYDFGSADAGARTVACSPKLVNICPTLVSEGEAVKVTMGEEVDGPKEISVVSVDGRVVYSVSTSDNTVSIPAALLPRGMNIVSVTYSGGSQETSRIMVR